MWNPYADNLVIVTNLGLEVLAIHHRAEGSLEAQLTVLAELQRQGLIRHIGLSNVTPEQVAEGRRICEIAREPGRRSVETASGRGRGAGPHRLSGGCDGIQRIAQRNVTQQVR